MAKATATTGTDGQVLHTRTTGDSTESQVVVIGTDGSDVVLDPSSLATQATLASVLAKLIAAPATEAKQDTANTALASILSAVDGLEGFTDGLETLQTAIRDRLPSALVKSALATTDAGTFGYAAGTAAATVDVPAGASVKRVSVLAGSGGAATVTIAGGNPISVPAAGSFDEQIPGVATAGGDVVIGGTVASYYVSWVA